MVGKRVKWRLRLPIPIPVLAAETPPGPRMASGLERDSGACIFIS